MPDLRPPSRDDAAVILEVIAARGIADVGEPDYTLEDLLHEWDDPAFDLAADARVAEADGRVAGYAAMRPGEVHAYVHPDAEGRGIGTALLEWAERRAAERGHVRHRQDIGERNGRARDLLAARGYTRARSYWRMVVDTDALAAEAPPPPGGIAARALDPDRDGPALHAISERAFAAVTGHRRETFEEFREEHLRVPSLDAGLSVVAERDGRPVAFALCRRWADEGRGYVDLLAVDPDAAGHGLGSWLLAAVFARCRAAALAQVVLGVASDNARATRLYERAGMRTLFRLDAYERDVAGADRATAAFSDQPPS